ERGAPQRLLGGEFGAHLRSGPKAWPSRGFPHELKPPLSRDLRDSGDPSPYPFGEPTGWSAAFQSAINLRSFCLRGSGAVAPSAPHPVLDGTAGVSSAGVDWLAE